MNDVLPHLVSLGPLYVVALAAATVLIRSGPSFMARWNERLRDLTRAKAGDWARLRGEINRLDQRCAAIEAREEECQRQLTGALHRIGELEGYNLGLGEARNTAQMIVSQDREKRKDGK